MKFAIQSLLIYGLVRAVVTPPPNIEQILATSAGHSLANSGFSLTGAEKLTTVYSVWFNKIRSDRNEFNSPLLQSFLEDRENARALILMFREAHMPDIASLLAERAYSPLIAQFNKFGSFEKLIELCKDLRDDRVLELLENSERYKEIIHDPFQAYLLNLKVPAIPKQDTAFYQRLRFASERNFEGSSDVLETLRNWERMPSEQRGEFLYTLKPYNIFISDQARAMDLLNRINSDPNSYPNFLNSRLFLFLKKAEYKNLFPQEETTAEKIAQSFIDLKPVGLAGEVQNSDGYVKFMRKGTDNHLAVLVEMQRLGFPEKDIYYQEALKSSVLNSLIDLTHREGVDANEFLEHFMMTKKGVQYLKQALNLRIGSTTLKKEIQVYNPGFIARFENAAAGLD